MKKLILLALILTTTSVFGQKKKSKIQERDYFPQQNEEGREIYRDNSYGDVLRSVYTSKYSDTVYVYFVKKWKLEVSNNNIFFNCKFTNFSMAYKKNKGQVKKYYDRGDRKGLPMFVGTYKSNSGDILILRENEDTWEGNFSNYTSEVIIKKGKNIYIFNLM